MRGPDPYRPCPCGSGKKYKFCCRLSGQALCGPEDFFASRIEAPKIPDAKTTSAGPEWFESPFATALVNSDCRAAGMASVVIGRFAAGRMFAHGFLVDTFGLGLKDCYPLNPIRAEWFRDTVGKGLTMQEIDLPTAQKLVWGGIHYAVRNGFRPPSCCLTCARATGQDPGEEVARPPMFGYNGEVRIIGSWEDLSRRTARRYRGMEEALADWERKDFVFLVGTEEPPFDAQGLEEI